MPSQILEEWMEDKEILKMVSKHYITGESLSDELIDNIRKLKKFDSGDWVQRQAVLSVIDLDYFSGDNIKDPQAIQNKVLTEHRKHIATNSNDHFYASFGHLMGYGAKYYSYLWSKVFALDIFSKIKKQGLLNPVAGRRYVDQILAVGGSKDPEIMLEEYLGRKPSTKAFFDDLGL